MKVCPLLQINCESDQLCMEENCGFWNVDQECCAISLIGTKVVNVAKCTDTSPKELEYEGKTYSLRGLSRLVGVAPSTMQYRLEKVGYDVQKAVKYGGN